jgi:predicted Zn-dependent peptidase
LSLAARYLQYLGTPTRSAEEIAQEMYQLACSFQIYASNIYTNIYISGLAENMPKAMNIVEDLIYNAVPDENILENLKADLLKERADAKLNQGSCFSALQNYIFLGADYVKMTTLTNEQIKSLTSEQLLGKIRDLMSCTHEVSYYGTATANEVTALITENHKIADNLKPLEKTLLTSAPTPSSKVYLAQYDAKQIYYLQYSNRQEKLKLEEDPCIKMYNEYFGGGMNAIVFQEMREARGLAYSSAARLIDPSHKDDSYKYYAFIATQNDKMKTAIEAFDEIINYMPESEAAFDVAKEAIITRLRTMRTTGKDIMNSYLLDRDCGLTENRNKHAFETLPSITLADVKKTQEEWVKGRKYTYGILGDIKDIDTKYLNTLGNVKVLKLEEIFGY